MSERKIESTSTNPYTASTEAAQPRTWRNFWRLMLAVGLLFVLPSLAVWGYLKWEQVRPRLFYQYESRTMDRNVEKWQKMHDSAMPATHIP